MRTLSNLDQIELLQLVRALEHENARLRLAVARAVCGDVLNFDTTCQLPREHEGCHAWLGQDGELLIRWG